MIPEALKKYIDELISESINEMDGATSTTASAGGEYSSKYAFAKKTKDISEDNKYPELKDTLAQYGASEDAIEMFMAAIDMKLLTPEQAIKIAKSTTVSENAPTLAAGKSNISTYTKDGFKKVKPGMPSDSRMFDYKQFPSTPKPKSIKLYKESIKDMINQELINEISYRRFAENVSKVSPERKITRALQEVTKRIKEIDQVIEYSNRLKTENTIKKESFWTNKTEQLNVLSEKLNEISNKIRTLSQ